MLVSVSVLSSRWLMVVVVFILIAVAVVGCGVVAVIADVRYHSFRLHLLSLAGRYVHIRSLAEHGRPAKGEDEEIEQRRRGTAM